MIERLRALQHPARVPWFRTRPVLTVVVALALFAAVFIARLLVGVPGDAIGMFFVLPIALLSLAFGLRPGLGAGAFAVGLLIAWVVVDGVALSALAWTTRITPLLLLGALLGHAADRLRRSEEERHRFAAAAQRHRDAVEINDTMIQGLAAAKWALETGNREGALVTIDDTLDTAQRVVSRLLRDAEMAPGARYAAVTQPQAVSESQPGR